jgi:hypothetical protein
MRVALAGRSVRGRVIVAEPVSTEDPDPDVCRFITRILWAVVLLPVIVVVVLICLLFRRSSAFNLLAMMGVFRFLNPAARSMVQAPVRYFRIREESSDAEVMVRMKGRYTHGSIGQDDIVTLTGHSHGGTLFAKRGYNHRTSSMVRLAPSQSWWGLVFVLLFMLLLVAAFHRPAVKTIEVVNSLGGAR